MSKYCKLIMVTDRNNNKFYEMHWDGKSPNFDVKFGRVEVGAQKKSYPIGKWESKKREKIDKGYRDVTDLVTVSVQEDKGDVGVGNISDMKVAQFLTLMKRYTDNLVSTTYSVKAESVSQAQIDTAQKLINGLNIAAIAKVGDDKSINELLVSLYTTIPRKMRSVKDHLLPSIKLDKVLEQEQDNLDAMASQVGMVTQAKSTNKKGKNLLDQLGLTMKECTVNQDINYLIKQVTGYTKVEAMFEVNKPSEDKTFKDWMAKQKNKETKILIHGTRNSSVLPILKTNLQIRPIGNFQFSGKVYGNGNYFSETISKSLNYTGNDTDKVLLVYEVHTGAPFTYEGWYRGNSFPLTYENLQQRGFDSTFVKAGNGLLNSEIIAYREEQNRIKYIIWLKN